MMNKRFVFTLFLMASFGLSHGQILKPETHADHSVTYRIKAPQADSVKVNVRNTFRDMKRDKDGLWSYTSEPQIPGIKDYSFLVDGLQISDPAAPVFRRLADRWISAFELPEQGTEDFFVQDVPHGEVRRIPYYSEFSEQWREMYIYTPACYDEQKDRVFPVVYLMHGGGECSAAWFEQGNTAAIMDNLIAKRKAVPMVIVATNGTVSRKTDRPAGFPPQIGGYGWEMMQLINDEMKQTVIPFAEKHYRVSSDRNQRAMCGLSMGGGQSFYVGLRNPDLFAHIGSFSAGIFGGIGTVKDVDLEHEVPGLLSRSSDFNKNLKLFYLSCGEQDPRLPFTQKAVETLRANGLKVYYTSFAGDHEWQVWRKSFHDFVQRVFK